MPKSKMKETNCEQKIMEYLNGLEPLRVEDGKKVVITSVREVAEATNIHRVTASRTFKRLIEGASDDERGGRLKVVGMDTSRQRRKHWKIVA